MPELRLLFLQMLVILVAAKAMGWLFRLIHQPEVLGEMLAGTFAPAGWRGASRSR